jgi:uncharacterized membrane protein
MNPSVSPTERGLTKSRIEALCDGVFAIAMTLMIFNIKVPEIPSELVGAELAHNLFNLCPQFLVYAMSFVMLGVYWVGHHNQYHYIRHTNRLLLWINVAFLLCVTFIPFSTALLGRYPTQQIALVVYALNLILVGIVLFVHWHYALSRRLLDAELDPVLVKLASRRILLAPAILVLAVVFSFVSTNISLGLCAIIPVLYVLPGRIDRHWTPTHTANRKRFSSK